ncbi:MAG: S8 family serine peptidase [Planctomycetota bacterium]
MNTLLITLLAMWSFHPPLQGERLNRDGGTPGASSIVLDDSIPLPTPAVRRKTPSGDLLVSPAQGDPHFLGFLSGRFTPRPDERIGAELRSPRAADDRPTGHAYAFVMFSKRITEERIDHLRALGCRVIGFHPHYSLKVALHAEAAPDIAALPFVRWVGPMPTALKRSPRLAAQAGDRLDVWVSVFESDLTEASIRQPVAAPRTRRGGAALSPERSEAQSAAIWQSLGWQHRALEAEGAEILEYVDGIRAFRARVDREDIPHVAGLDFVQFIEPFEVPRPAHDESMPMVLADRTRDSWDGSVSGEVIVGIIDTGVDTGHLDLNVDGAGWTWSGGPGPFEDGCGHGSHVAGTMLGRGVASEGHRGVAHGLASWGGTSRLFNAKVFDDDSCSWTPPSPSSVYAVMENPYFDGTDTTPKPHVINNSWGLPGTDFVGSEADARAVDDQVWDHEQLYVFAGGNEGPGTSTLRLQAVAKNAFTVANVTDFHDPYLGDPGVLWDESSQGPAGDGRWKPNLAAPGTWISSALSGTTSDYIAYTGTSMATPHVTGVAAQLADAYAYVRYAPHRMASILMATAITKDDIVLDAPSSDPNHHLNSYGAGRLNAYKALFQTSQLEWTNWGFTQDSSGFSFGDFTVESDVERLIVVMTYHEPACSAGASQALVSDIDLWIDQDPIDPAGNTGEWFSHQSIIDNTEIRILDAPAAGPWRWKTWPTSVIGTARVSVTVAKIHGDTTPSGAFNLTASDLCVQPGASVDITATATCDSAIASAVFCDSTVTGSPTLAAATTTLDDGAVTDLLGNAHSGFDLVLGDIRHGLDRSATWSASWASEGVWTWSVEARSDNWTNQTDSVAITVDGTAPSSVSGLVSTTHVPFAWSIDPNITFEWTAATDALSGLVGYSFSISDGATGTPDTVQDLALVTTHTETVVSAPIAQYFNIRAVDACGNWGASESVGPYYVDDVLPTIGTLEVDSGAISTPAVFVSLDALSARDDDSGVAFMQFSNDGRKWSEPEPYAPHRPQWDLSSHGGDRWPGLKTVFARYRDLAGNWGAEVQDTIAYEPVPQIDEITPATGPSKGGNTVTIRGDGYSPSTEVFFGGKVAEVTVLDPATLRVIVPPHPITARGKGPLDRLAESVDVVVMTEHGDGVSGKGYEYRALRR